MPPASLPSSSSRSTKNRAELRGVQLPQAAQEEGPPVGVGLVVGRELSLQELLQARGLVVLGRGPAGEADQGQRQEPPRATAHGDLPRPHARCARPSLEGAGAVENGRPWRVPPPPSRPSAPTRSSC